MSKISLVFPGQGSQYVGMGHYLYNNYQVARDTFKEACEAAKIDICKVCFEGNQNELTRTEFAQPAIFVCSVAAFRVFEYKYGIEPSYAAGHSLGEISALTCSGAIKFYDAVKIVFKRGKLMRDAHAQGYGAMAAVIGLNKDIVEAECQAVSSSSNVVAVSNYNGRNQIVISGHSDAVRKVGSRLEGFGARVVPLQVSAPFHSVLMSPAAYKFKEELNKYSYHSFRWPVISNVTGLPYDHKDEIVDKLVRQITSPVQWTTVMDYLDKAGVDILIELGPKEVLKKLALEHMKGIKAYSYDNKDDLAKIDEHFNLKSADKSMNMDLKSSVVGRCLALAVCTKNRNNDSNEYKEGVVKAYKRIQELYNRLEEDKRDVTYEHMLEALNMLKTILISKRVPLDKRVEYLKKIITETCTYNMFRDFDMVN